MSDTGEWGVPSKFAEQVLDLVDLIPAGRVLAYGDVARLVGGGGPRQVGAALARFGCGCRRRGGPVPRRQLSTRQTVVPAW